MTAPAPAPTEPDPTAGDADAVDDSSTRVDTLTLAGQVLVEAFEALKAKPAAGQRLEDKIALGHALATLGHAQTVRRQVAVMEQVTSLQLADRAAAIAAQQAAEERAKGPAGIVVPQLNVAGR